MKTQERQLFRIVEFPNPSGEIAYRVTGMRVVDGVKKQLRENFSGENAGIKAKARQQELEREAMNMPALPATVTHLSADQCREAEACLNRLKGHKLTLTMAVDFALKNWTDTQKACSVRKAVELFLKSKEDANRRSATRQNLKSRCNLLLKHCPDKQVSEVTTDDCKAMVFRAGSGPYNRLTDRRALSNFFNWAVAEGYRALTPMQGLPEITTEESEPVCLTNAEARKLAEVARTFKNGKLSPYVVVTLFCGLRPAEAKRLTWDRIDLADTMTIKLDAKITKLSQRRLVSIPPNARLLLADGCKHKTPFVGKNWRKDFEKVRELAGLKAPKDCEDENAADWTADVLRHTALSNHLMHMTEDKTITWAGNGNIGTTASWAGNSPETIHKHYRGLILERDAKVFWTIGTAADLEALKAA